MKNLYIITIIAVLSTTKICFAQIGKLAAPTNLTGVEATLGTITLTWTDNSNNESGFIIEYQTADNNWYSFRDVSANLSTYTFERNYCEFGTQMRFRIIAFKRLWGFIISRSDPSNTAIVSLVRPDPAIASYSLNPTTITMGGSINANCTISNVGLLNMQTTATLVYYIVSSPYVTLHSEIIEILPIGASITKNTLLNIPSNYSGDCYIQCTIIYYGYELVSQNNFIAKKITIINPNDKPDLTITNASTTSTDGTILVNYEEIPKFYTNNSSTHYMNVSYKNIGDAPFNSQAILRIYLSQDNIVDNNDYPIGNGNHYIESLSVGEAYTKSVDYSPMSFVPITFFTYSGVYYLLTKIDANNQVDEKSESNNIYSTKIYIQKMSSKVIKDQSSQSKSENNGSLYKKEINIYPNPSNGNFTVNFGNDSYTEVKVYSLLGQLVYTENISNKSSLELILSNLTDGTYILKLISDVKVETRKIIIQK